MTSLPLVVGAIIVDRYPNPSRVLAARRTRPASLAGQWEFPGGKIEPGETAMAALTRELAEELSVEVTVYDELLPEDGETWAASNGYRMRLFFATTLGEAVPKDGHDEVRWLSASELHSVPWLQSDLEALDRLVLD